MTPERKMLEAAARDDEDGVMAPAGNWGQECPACNFVCNTLPEQPGASNA